MKGSLGNGFDVDPSWRRPKRKWMRDGFRDGAGDMSYEEKINKSSRRALVGCPARSRRARAGRAWPSFASLINQREVDKLHKTKVKCEARPGRRALRAVPRAMRKARKRRGGLGGVGRFSPEEESSSD